MHNRSFLVRCCVFGLFIAVGLLAGARAEKTAAAGRGPIFLPMVRSSSSPVLSKVCLSGEENKLAQLINNYRGSKGLSAAPLSMSLTKVAQTHVNDLQANRPDTGTDGRGMACNLHSWSNKGYWTPVCYTSDHKYADGMWFKPKEITRGVYTDFGFEIAAAYWGKSITAEDAFNMWKASPGHNDVILEQNGWSGKRWPAMGIGISPSYAVVWFSSTKDPAGSVSGCQ